MRCKHCVRVRYRNGRRQGYKTGFVFVMLNGQELKKIADLINEGKGVPPQIEEMLLENAAAHEKIRKGHTRGKIVLKVT